MQRRRSISLLWLAGNDARGRLDPRRGREPIDQISKPLSDLADTFFAGLGNDTIAGGGGNDRLEDATLASSVDIMTGAGTDTASYAWRANTIVDAVARTFVDIAGADGFNDSAPADDFVVVVTGAADSGEPSRDDLIGNDFEHLIGGGAVDDRGADIVFCGSGGADIELDVFMNLFTDITGYGCDCDSGKSPLHDYVLWAT